MKKAKDTIRHLLLKAPSLTCKIRVSGWSFFVVGQIICQVAVAQPALTHAASDSLEVGDIPFDPAIDDPAFTICDARSVLQYYNTGSYFLDHKRQLVKYFTDHYRAGRDTAAQTGYLTVRFVINCAGETGRFRTYELDSGYRSCRFSAAISGQLLTLIRQWKGWQPATYHDKVYDSYQYITFTLKRGRVVWITP